MMMWVKIWQIRLWRRYRRHFLSMEELSMRNDLTLTEVILVAKAMKLVEGQQR